ncbi:hypothetical protein [Aquimarina sp. LLG6339-5]|uniref:hypothetical protein n=1 Tax=Aquimarina sp. LLG6339-5 TaxID=3160830 RepID=UPI003868F318
MKTKILTYLKINIPFLCLLCCLATLVSFKIMTQKEKLMQQEEPEKFLCIEIYGKKGSNVKVRLNDIPVCELLIENEKGYGNSLAFVNYYAIPGINTLSVYPLSQKGAATIRLARYTKGEITGENNGETLIKIEIKNNNTPIHKKIELSANRKRWSWIDTDIINDKKSKKEAITFSKSFYKMMEQNDISRMITTADPILNYEILSKPETSKEKLIEEWTKGLNLAFTEKDIYDDIDSIRIKLTPIANGKLFEVTREDGSFLFRTSDKNEFPVGFKSIIGRKNEVWKFYH